MGNWKRFLRAHLKVTSVADFFTAEVWTLKGLVRYHVFFVMSLDKRKVQIAHIGVDPDGDVMAQVARNLTDYEDGFLKGQRYFICDNDSLYSKAFKKTLLSSGVQTIQTKVKCPVQNAYAESFVANIRRECLDHFIFLGENSLRKAVNEYVEHYHHERNHQGLNNVIPFPTQTSEADNQGTIRKVERLGGVLNYYYRESNSEQPKDEQTAA